MSNIIVGDNEFTNLGVSTPEPQNMGANIQPDTQPDTQTDTQTESGEVLIDMSDEVQMEIEEPPLSDALKGQLKEMIDESVHHYLSQMKDMFMMELITHLLDQKRTYELEDNEFNKLTDEDKKKVNSFIRELTK